MAPPDTLPEDDDLAAAELALRLDDSLAARADQDSEFARAHDAWTERLSPLIAEIPAVDAPAGVWPRVELALAAGLGGSGAANDNDARAVFWRRWAIGSTGLLAASLVAVAVLVANPVERVVQAPATAPVEAVRVATLATADGGQPAVIITYDPATGALWVSPTRALQPGETVPALWLVNPDGTTRLVGEIDPDEAQTHTLPEALRPGALAAAQLAISLEPAGEPIAPQARGPVVAIGEVERL